MCSVKCMYDLPYEMQYELYSDMVKQLYCGSYSIYSAFTPKQARAEREEEVVEVDAEVSLLNRNKQRR